jgi:uncharacterized protein
MHRAHAGQPKAGQPQTGSAPMNLALLPQAPVWVLDDPRSPAAGQASAIAGRLGLPFRRLNAAPGQPHRPGGPGPGLVLSAGAGSGLRALLLRSRHGCRVVHCTARQPLAPHSPWLPFDLTVVPESDVPYGLAGSSAACSRVIPVLGAPNVVSPALLARARDLWAERLSHLPRPRVVLLFGGSDQRAAVELGRHLGALARERGGCVMAAVLPSGLRAADALAGGLSACLHLIYRAGEPGEDPTLGFLGHAEAVVVAGVGALTLSEACAASAPIFAAAPDGERRDTRRLFQRLRDAGQIRPLQEDLSPWPRQPLDEAGRIAREIRARFGGGSAIDRS